LKTKGSADGIREEQSREASSAYYQKKVSDGSDKGLDWAEEFTHYYSDRFHNITHLLKS
jgi:hypothetical protein